MFLLVVLCIISSFSTFAQNEGDIQLVSGRLEIFYNGTWGTVCDDSFDDIDAQVACRQLGYNNGFFIGSFTKYTEWKIWLDDVDCSGAENKLSHCTHAGWGVENCFRGENVKIQCNNASEGDVRNSSGKLEILHNNEWGTVCSSNFNNMESQVACQQLGYSNGSVLVNTIATGFSKIWLNILACNGGESKLIECSHTDWGTHTCSHGNVVGIRCVGEQGDVRINSNRLEIYYNGTWGTVCDDDFDDRDALVACRQLGYRGGISLGSSVAAGNGAIWLDDMRCNGHESTLALCLNSGWGEHNCVHREDVGIKCSNSNNNNFHESDILIIAERLEIFHNNEWGTVCSEDFDNIDATVACRQLGYRLGDVRRSRRYDYGKIWLSKVNCTGGERNLASCLHTAWGKNNCRYYVTIACNNETSVSGDIRITSGSLEIFHDFEWGTVYYGNFDDYAATVACRQLGYSTGISLGNIVRTGNGKVWLDDIKCTGVESKLTDCVIENWGITSRYHSGDVEIRCSNDSTIVDGKWLSWANWIECSKSCDNGIQTRSRTCNNPPPSNGGLPCKGETLEAQLCNKIPCPVNGSWGPWSIWNTCNVTCGGGTHWRFRHCNSPTSVSGGSDCGTDNYEIKDCNTDNCPGLESSTKRIGKYLGVVAGCIVVTVLCVLVCRYFASRIRTQNKDNSYRTALKTVRRAEGPDRADDCVIVNSNDSNDDDKDEGLMYETVE